MIGVKELPGKFRESDTCFPDNDYGRNDFGKGDIHLWRIYLDHSEESHSLKEEYLSDEENERAKRFVRALERNRFIRTRVALRKILGQYLGCRPERIELLRNQFGKPYIANETGLKFNLSHSHSYAFLAISENAEIGVDIEKIDPDIDHTSIIEHFFSTDEKDQFQALSRENRLRGFYKGWTTREAFLKATGYGIRLPVEQITATLDPDRQANVIDKINENGSKKNWSFIHLEPMQGWFCAIAVHANPINSPKSFLFDWN